jgi:hypothetical protein
VPEDHRSIGADVIYEAASIGVENIRTAWALDEKC